MPEPRLIAKHFHDRRGGDESLFLFNYKIFAIYPPPLSNKRGGKGKVAFRVNRPIKESVALLDNVELCQPFRGLHSIRSDLHSPTERKRRGYPSTFERPPPKLTRNPARKRRCSLFVINSFRSPFTIYLTLNISCIPRMSGQKNICILI